MIFFCAGGGGLGDEPLAKMAKLSKMDKRAKELKDSDNTDHVAEITQLKEKIARHAQSFDINSSHLSLIMEA